MLDSLLTITKRGFFWLVLAWIVVIAFDRVVSIVSGSPISFASIAVILIPLYLLVAGPYTLIKKAAQKRRESADSDKPVDEQ
jgi:hypothetical protein